MTPARFERRLKFWQKRMLLSDWKIVVEHGPLEHAERADCDAKPSYREAVIRVDLSLIADGEIEAFCVHELLHCWTWPLEQAAENWAGDDEKLFEAVRDTAEDVATDLERVILNVHGTR